MDPTAETCMDGGEHEFVYSHDVDGLRELTVTEECGRCGIGRHDILLSDGGYGYAGCDAGRCAGGGKHDWKPHGVWEFSPPHRTFVAGCTKCDGRREEFYRYERTYYAIDGEIVGQVGAAAA